MTTPAVPLRLEIAVEVPGTAEQVWHAIATGAGITSWFLPTDLEGREGGRVVTHMGEESSPGTVTGWDPPRRLAYEEPDWASLVGEEGGDVTPLATEFLVEARSGGTCVVRVVSSAFGTGADWEQEFFDEMEKGWVPFFDHLRMYLTHFPGQAATPLSVWADHAGSPAAVAEAMGRALGIDAVGQAVKIHGLAGEVDTIEDERVFLRLSEPLPGYMALGAYSKGEGLAGAQIAGYLFSPEAPAYIEREHATWRSWLENLAV